MPADRHRFRQVHLDFHTSDACEKVGVDFDPQTFVETLKMGHVDTINIFAKCHHGYSYYPTRVGRQHPNLSFDLLGTQIQALHKADIRCPIYISVKWDDLSGMQHPEWVAVRKDGTVYMRPPATSPMYTWSTMDLSSAYSDVFLAQVEEICDRFQGEIDGFWFDICFPAANYSAWSQAQMRKAGVNLADDRAVWGYARRVDLEFFDRLTQLVKARAPGATYYLNGTTTADMAEVAPYVTQFEVESLPTSGDAWGYLHYPIMARHARTQGVEIIGMTGRFHRSWADFGGLKTRDQLDYECGTILAAGGKICVGDQLHPGGVLDPAVYRLLGHSFDRVEKLEPWLEGARPTAEAAVLALGQPVEVLPGIGSHSPDVEGTAQFLLESGIQFDIIDAGADLAKYPLLFLPDKAVLTPSWQARLEAFLAGGGKLVLSGTASLAQDAAGVGRFLLKEAPAVYKGPVPTVPSYLRPDAWLADRSELAPDYDYVFYDQASLVEPLPGSEAHGLISRALFNRTWEHFTSHAHPPLGEPLGAPVTVQNEQVLYFAAPLFGAYRTWDYWAYRAIAQNALRKFMPAPLLIPGGPGWVEFALHTQIAAPNHPARRIVHVVAYHPRRSLQSIPHVDQSWPVSGLSVRVRLDGITPKAVYQAPDRAPLGFSLADGYIKVELPPAGAHTVIVIE